MEKDILNFFQNRYEIDLSDIKVFFISMSGRIGAYDKDNNTVLIDSSIDMGARELTLAHEYAHAMFDRYHVLLTNEKEEYLCNKISYEYADYILNRKEVI